MLDEFKKFIAQGNVLDLAVGIIIGGAFGKIVSSMVSDVIMPLVGKVMNGVNFAESFIALNGQAATTLEEAKKGGAVLAYGSFMQNIIDFLIVAFVIFMLVRQANKLKKPAPTPAA